jgi:branched-chain amino acid transport system permease protein
MRGSPYVPIIVAAGLVAAFGVALEAVGASKYYMALTMAVYYAVAILGLCLLMGYAGQISLGHAGFFAIGGYTSAVLTTYNLVPHAGAPLVRALDRLGLLLRRTDLYDTEILHVSPWLALAAAMLVAAAVALVVGIPTIRLRGHYLAMATLGFGIIVHRICLGTRLLGEADGISGVPPFPIAFGLQVTSEPGPDMAYRTQNYFIAWAVAFLAIVLLVNLLNSRVGRALRSIHENEEAANALGVNTARYKLATFVLSAVLAAVAGALFTHYTARIGPSQAEVMQSVRFVAIVAVGGMANIWGALGMGLALNFLWLRGVFTIKNVNCDDAVFAGILIAIMVFAPRGLFRLDAVRGAAAALRERWHGRTAA